MASHLIILRRMCLRCGIGFLLSAEWICLFAVRTVREFRAKSCGHSSGGLGWVFEWLLTLYGTLVPFRLAARSVNESAPLDLRPTPLYNTPDITALRPVGQILNESVIDFIMMLLPSINFRRTAGKSYCDWCVRVGCVCKHFAVRTNAKLAKLAH